ncbi:MAG: hypothetical protein QOF21_2359 [Actinomycetota bacterium]
MEIVTQTFKLRPGADREAFLAADKAMQEEVVYQLPGLVRRTVAHNAERDDVLFVTFWAGDPGYHRDEFANNPLTKAVGEFIDESTIAGWQYQDIGG